MSYVILFLKISLIEITFSYDKIFPFYIIQYDWYIIIVWPTPLYNFRKILLPFSPKTLSIH
jgi:hypothetical protein